MATVIPSRNHCGGGENCRDSLWCDKAEVAMMVIIIVCRRGCGCGGGGGDDGWLWLLRGRVKKIGADNLTPPPVTANRHRPPF